MTKTLVAQENKKKMDELLSCTKYLGERGLTVRRYLKGVEVAASEPLPGETLYLAPTPSGWVVEQCVPMEGGLGDPRDFRIEYEILDDALLVTWNYFFGQVVFVGDWAFALHKHPYWPLAKLQYRLANLVHVDDVAFAAIEEKRRHAAVNCFPGLRPRQEDRERWLAWSFVRCDPVSGLDTWLMMRRDLEEAYVVRKKALGSDEQFHASDCPGLNQV